LVSVLKNFLKEMDLEISEFAVLELILYGDSDHLTLINRTLDRLQFLDALPANNLASQLENKGAACDGSAATIDIIAALSIVTCIGAVSRLQLIQEGEIGNFFLGDSAFEIDLELEDAFGFPPDRLLLLMMEVPATFKFDPIMHNLIRRVLDLNKLGTLFPQITRKINRFGLGQLLRQ